MMAVRSTFGCLVSASKVDEVLQRAIAAGDEKALARILAVIHYSQPQLTAKTLETVARLTLSTIDLVRSFALGICAASGDKNALGAVVASGWSARTADGKRRGFESWYGSQAILEAAKQGLLSLDDALDRMSLGHFGFAAIELGSAAAAVIAGRIEQALERALEVGELTDLPGMRTRAPDASDTSPPLMSLDEPPAANFDAQMDRFSESREDFDKRQKRLGRAFGRFVRQLSAAEADLILDDLTLKGTIAILETSPGVHLNVLVRLSAASDKRLQHLHHIAVQVSIAGALAGLPEGASLLRRAMKLDPTVRRVQGMVKLPAEAVSLWRHADNAACVQICRERLTTLDNDHDISLEVLAALTNGREALVEEVTDHLLATGEPAGICRAVTIAGFSDVNPHADCVLDRFAEARGYVGVAVKAARGAYDRNRWARHWYDEMRKAETHEAFWQASVLFTKVVDARFVLWRCPADRSTLFGRCWSSVKRETESRVDKWHNKRKDKLFGDNRPEPIFLSTSI